MPLYVIKAFYIAPDEGTGQLVKQWDESPAFPMEPGISEELYHSPAAMEMDHFIQEIKAYHAAHGVPFSLERAELWDVEANIIVHKR